MGFLFCFRLTLLCAFFLRHTFVGWQSEANEAAEAREAEAAEAAAAEGKDAPTFTDDVDKTPTATLEYLMKLCVWQAELVADV